MQKNKKKRTKIQEIKTSFTGGTLTNYSGIKTFHTFMQILGLINSLDSLSIKLHHNAKYSTGTILSTVILGILSGMNRIKKIEQFTYDPLLQSLFGLEGSISDSTISDRMKRFSMKQTTEFMDLNGRMSKKIHLKLKTQTDILDIDSTPKTVYGVQEGAEKGFNTQKKGKKSYHPLMGFLDSSRECILSWLRPGNTYTANNADEFLKQAFTMLHKGIKQMLVRADSGFFSDKIISVIEKKKDFNYLIKVKLKNMKSVLSGQDWYDIPCMPNTQICDFDYRPESWDKSRHFSAVRKVKAIHTEGHIFPFIEWQYFCYCTDIEDSPLQIHRLYGDRGTSENWIENVKNHMFAGQLLTNDFWTNEAMWLSSVMAYNVSVWMRKLCDEKSWHEEPSTFRSWFVQLAGKIVRSGRCLYLKMYKAYYYKERWRKIENAVDNLIFA